MLEKATLIFEMDHFFNLLLLLTPSKSGIFLEFIRIICNTFHFQDSVYDGVLYLEPCICYTKDSLKKRVANE